MAKIVFCEDEVRIQKLIRTILRTTSHEVFIASDGIEGFEVIQRERPDLIFTDISMPHWDGFQLASAVKARPELAHIPIVFLTAFAQRAEVDEGYRHGAVSYLIKPFSPAELRDKVEEFITTFSMPDSPA
jgi:CheY-like chemotaxis protein